MNITQEQLQQQITKLKVEQAGLQTMHDKMVADFQQQEQHFRQRVQLHQNRFQQIIGALGALSELLSLEMGNNGAPEMPQNRMTALPVEE